MLELGSAAARAAAAAAAVGLAVAAGDPLASRVASIAASATSVASGTSDTSDTSRTSATSTVASTAPSGDASRPASPRRVPSQPRTQASSDALSAGVPRGMRDPHVGDAPSLAMKYPAEGAFGSTSTAPMHPLERTPTSREATLSDARSRPPARIPRSWHPAVAQRGRMSCASTLFTPRRHACAPLSVAPLPTKSSGFSMRPGQAARAIARRVSRARSRAWREVALIAGTPGSGWLRNRRRWRRPPRGGRRPAGSSRGTIDASRGRGALRVRA